MSKDLAWISYVSLGVMTGFKDEKKDKGFNKKKGRVRIILIGDSAEKG